MLFCTLKHLARLLRRLAATVYTVYLRQGYGVHGRLTEWLGSGLQNRVRRFDSATDLNFEAHHVDNQL